MHENTFRRTLRLREVVHEISGAIIAITLVMTSVFIPVTFMTGPVGVFYRQFGLTMAMSIMLSGIVALTLTPRALCDAAQTAQSECQASARAALIGPSSV
ncbi:MAG: efflux RND transporter permease subunit [Pirellulales bacterium]